MTALDAALIAVHALILYAWIGFPALLALLRPRYTEPAQPEIEHLPNLAVILSAYQEESCIADRIRNLLEQEYPREKLAAYIGVDGCKDRTGPEALGAAHGRDSVRVLVFPENRGKVAVLKDLVHLACGAEATPDILVFTDANTFFAPDALRRLCAPFSSSSVGGVCGRLQFTKADGTETQENIYWRLENWLKTKESALDSCLGANGAIYGIRSSLFWHEIPANTIIDDFVIGMKVRQRNFRMVYEPRAIAVENLPFTVTDEWKRRVRIGAGDFQALQLCSPCLGPFYGTFAWMFWSHKVLRWFTSHLALAGAVLILADVSLARSPLGFIFLALYLAAGLVVWLGGLRSRSSGRVMQILGGLNYLVAMNAAIFAGFLRFCRGNLEGRWQRTERL